MKFVFIKHNQYLVNVRGFAPALFNREHPAKSAMLVWTNLFRNGM